MQSGTDVNALNMFPLHKSVFENDIGTVKSLLTSDENVLNVDKLKDKHGNSPLHISVCLGHKECTHALLQHNHPVNIKNMNGWTPIQEATSYGDKEILSSLYEALYKQDKQSIKEKKDALFNALDQLGGDFVMELHWDFQTWVPLVSKILPSDTCHIYRLGNKIRMDSTLVDFSDMRWIRGDISVIIDYGAEPEPEIVMMDNVNKVYQRMIRPSKQERQASIDDEVDVTMSTDIVDASIKTSNVVVDRVQEGFFFRQDKCQKIGRFSADIYRIRGLTFRSRKRREHLSEDDIKKNKALREALSKGENAEVLEQVDAGNIESRRSLPAPAKLTLSWAEYIASLPGQHEALGRKMIMKTNTRTFDPVIGVSQEFPITLQSLLPILEALGTKAKLFSKLSDFVNMKLPPGFPVRIDVPIFPTVKATVSFPQFEFKTDLDPSFFCTPGDYVQDASWFHKSNREKQKEKSKFK